MTRGKINILWCDVSDASIYRRRRPLKYVQCTKEVQTVHSTFIYCGVSFSNVSRGLKKCKTFTIQTNNTVYRMSRVFKKNTQDDFKMNQRKHTVYS